MSLAPFDAELIAEIQARLPLLGERFGEDVAGDIDELLTQIEIYLAEGRAKESLDLSSTHFEAESA